MGKEKSSSGKPRSNKHASRHAEKSAASAQAKLDSTAASNDGASATETSQKQQQSMYPVLSFSNLLLFAFTCLVMWAGCTYQKLFCMIYCTEQWHFFDHVMKVLMNHFNYSHVERSLGRNLIFNTLRCMPEELIAYIVFERVEPTEVLLFRLCSIWLLTIAVHICVSKREARGNPNAWACMIIFYVHSYGIQFTRAISICEQTHNGDLGKLLFYTFALIIAYLQGDVIEDCLFGDLDRIGGIWHNWAFFMPPYTIIILGYLLGHQLHGHEVHGAWRHPTQPLLDSVTKTGQAPLTWPSVMYAQNENELFSVVLMANLVYGLTTYYYQVCWKKSIKMSKHDLVRKDCDKSKEEIIEGYVEKFMAQEKSTSSSKKLHQE